MINLPEYFRMARPEDAQAMAELVNMAGEGLPCYLWSQIAVAGQSPWEVGQNRARRESGAFSWRNTIVREQYEQVVAAMVGYALEANPEPSDYTDMPAMFVPLQQLEDLVPGTWYVNVLATFPAFRKQGIAKDLLKLAELAARQAGSSGMSIVVADTNRTACALYESLGYQHHAQRPMVKDGWQHPGTQWLLLHKSLA